MATIKLRIHVAELDNVLTLFDKIKVYKSTTGETGIYNEITTVGTRVALVAGTTVYIYDDTSGAASHYYKTSYFNSGTAQESSLSDPIKGEGTGSYVSIQDFRDEGVTTTDASDARLLYLMSVWESFINAQTGQFFSPKDLTITVDGNDSDILFLNVPIINVSSLKINEDTTALDPSFYVVYDSIVYPDDRKNPKIRIKRQKTTDIFARYSVNNLYYFQRGYRNQEITGTFGYTEADGSAPPLISYAVKKLVIKHMELEGEKSPYSPAGAVIREVTDEHSLQFEEQGDFSKSGPLLTNDKEIDNIIKMYKRPIALGTATTWNDPVILK